MSETRGTLAGFDYRLWGSPRLGVVRFGICPGGGLEWSWWALLLGAWSFAIHPPSRIATWLRKREAA